MKKHIESHSSRSQRNKSDDFGVGFKNPVGKMREIMGESKLSPKKMKKQPRKMA